MASLHRALFGTDEAVPPTLALTTGPLTVRLRGTRVVGIHVDGHEVWHGVAFLYRDRHWGTPEPVVERLDHWRSGDGFHVEVDAVLPAVVPLDLRITIDADGGLLRYAAAATPRGDVETNRTGLCLLHPQDLAGQAIELRHDDGRTSRSTFPQLIAPWPPFMNLRGIGHAFGDGGWAEARFDGDRFEFEDQRNNADASFKTYNRSNLMPRPYRLRGGQVIRQAVELRLVRAPGGQARTPKAAAPSPARCPAGPMKLGVAIESSSGPETDLARSGALAGLRPAFLHLALPAPDPDLDWSRIARLCEAAQAPLRLDLARLDEATAHHTLHAMAQASRAAGVRPEALAVFPSTPPIVDAARSAFPGIATGGGTPWFFTQLNRIEDLGALDFLSFTTSALVHGSDEESVMAGLASLRAMADTLAAYRPGLPVRVGPSGIAAPGGSPLGSQPASDGRRRMAMAATDPRTRALFGAAWLVGYLARCAEAGFDTATAARLEGADGLFDAGEPCPAMFALARLQGTVRRHPTHGAAESPGLAVLHGARGRLVANLTEDPIGLTVPDGESLHVIDARAWLAWTATGTRAAGTQAWRLHEGGSAAVLDAFAIGWIESL